MRKTIAAIGIAVAALTAQALIPTEAQAAPVRIEEDQPGWDCHTMGNRVCGAPAEDPTVCTWNGQSWVSAYSRTLGEPCKFGL